MMFTQTKLRPQVTGTKWGLGPRKQAEAWSPELGHRLTKKVVRHP